MEIHNRREGVANQHGPSTDPYDSVWCLEAFGTHYRKAVRYQNLANGKFQLGLLASMRYVNRTKSAIMSGEEVERLLQIIGSVKVCAMSIDQNIVRLHTKLKE